MAVTTAAKKPKKAAVKTAAKPPAKAATRRTPASGKRTTVAKPNTAAVTAKAAPPSQQAFDKIKYREAKIILDGMLFTSVDSFKAFEKILKRAAKGSGVDYERDEGPRKPRVREVLFLDTKDFRLYNNAFILRRRNMYQDGFLVGDPEIVFKFRHTDRKLATEQDVHPHIPGGFKVKFKAEALPLKDRPGGLRMLYSHNAQFNMSQVPYENRTSTETLMKIFPILEPLFRDHKGHVELVNRTAVNEVLQDLGVLDFGKGVRTKCNIAVWRSRGDERQLCGEFAFQAKFEDESELDRKARDRAKEFFLALQHEARDWLALGMTKTGAVYRLHGNPPQSHE